MTEDPRDRRHQGPAESKPEQRGQQHRRDDESTTGVQRTSAPVATAARRGHRSGHATRRTAGRATRVTKFHPMAPTRAPATGARPSPSGSRIPNGLCHPGAEEGADEVGGSAEGERDAWRQGTRRDGGGDRVGRVVEPVGVTEDQCQCHDEHEGEVHRPGLLDRNALNRVGHRLEGVDGCLQGLDDEQQAQGRDRVGGVPSRISTVSLRWALSPCSSRLISIQKSARDSGERSRGIASTVSSLILRIVSTWRRRAAGRWRDGAGGPGRRRARSGRGSCPERVRG